jgi:Protein of unknown function (DUF1579)
VKKNVLIALLAVIGCIAMFAQDNSKPAGSSAGKPSEQAAMQMPAPAPEMMKLIKQMSGTWNVTEKAFPSPMMPNGGTGTGTATFTPGPGNLSLIEKYHSVGVMPGSFNAWGVFWWDAKAQVYRGTWCDNTTPGGCDSGGTTKWAGANLVGTMESDMNGQKMMSRFTYSDWKPNSFLLTMEMGPDMNSMQKAMTFTYSKGAPAGPEKPASKSSQ